ncbi:serine hydrolase [Antarcticibacterium flavum]|uniref:Serine hydrolase n=1 Tax=Antarcticibacterium flavum TaxID=2058175 RepID=A0A5B7X1L9_9FLAO|nr:MULTISPECIES: serine hydrolase [Antarcticibacterium]MCM4158657.1 serine hydrolase [Antarcticibacterium sp. W02-3]QCY68511.1 serine hydrolase [Antarcticibacterium flavum]
MKKIWKLSLLLILVALLVTAYIYYPRLNIITGFAAKNVCSAVFEAERDLISVEEGDNDFAPVNLAHNEVDLENRLATSSVFGLKKRTAIYREGAGCTLLPENSDFSISGNPVPQRNSSVNSDPYPYGDGEPRDTIFPNIDQQKLLDAVSLGFDAEGEVAKRTRAVLVIYKNRLIAEEYSDGFSAETKILGWSMTKSVTSTVLGVMARQGRISIDQTNLFPEWEKDARSKISLNNLLQMSSALEWEEDYSKISDVTRMLFLAENMTCVQLEKTLVGDPGTIWNYSSGTSNLLSKFIRDQFNSHQEYLDYWYSELIDKVGMNSMTLEMDPAGYYVGSSYSWATARDWGKFGLLYLNNGNWNGEQILDPSWVEYSANPTQGSNGEYGAHFWLNAGKNYPDLPEDLFSANGFQGQHVFIIPSRDLVIVRFGLVEHPDFDINSFLKEILSSIQ